jgi:hypothetical protein
MAAEEATRRFDGPTGITVDANGNVLVAGEQRSIENFHRLAAFSAGNQRESAMDG